jgi:hypothetical protein
MKTLFVIALLAGICLKAEASLLAVSNGYGASNTLENSTTLWGNVTSTNGGGLIVTNSIVLSNALTGAKSYFTNTAAQFGKWSTNLTTLPSATPFAYLASAADTNGTTNATSWVTFSTHVGSIITNQFLGSGIIQIINTNNQAVQLILTNGSSIFISGQGTLGTGSGGSVTGLVNAVGDANISIVTNGGVASVTVSNKSVLAKIIAGDAGQFTNAALPKLLLNDGGPLTNLNDTSKETTNATLNKLALNDGGPLTNLNDTSKELTNAALNKLALNDGGALTNLPPGVAITNANIGGGPVIFAGNVGGTNQFKTPISSDTTRLTVTGNGTNLVLNPSSLTFLVGDSGRTLGDLKLNDHLSLAKFGPVYINLTDANVNNGANIAVDDNGTSIYGLNAGEPLAFSNFTGGVTLNGSTILTAGTTKPILYFYAGPQDQTAAISAALASNDVRLVFLGKGAVFANGPVRNNGALNINDSIFVITNAGIEIDIAPGTWLSLTNPIISPNGSAGNSRVVYINLGAGASDFWIHGGGGVQGPGRYGTNIEMIAIAATGSNKNFRSDHIVYSGWEGFCLMLGEPFGRTDNGMTGVDVQYNIFTNTGGQFDGQPAGNGDGAAIAITADNVLFAHNLVWDSTWRGVEKFDWSNTFHNISIHDNIFGNILGEAIGTTSSGSGKGYANLHEYNNVYYDAFPVVTQLNTAVTLGSIGSVPCQDCSWENISAIVLSNACHNPLIYIPTTGLTNATTIDGLYASGGRVEGIFVQGAPGDGAPLLLKNIRSINNNGAGIDFQGTTNVTISGSTFTGNAGTDTLVEASSSVSGYADTNGVLIGAMGPALAIGPDVSPSAKYLNITGTITFNCLYATNGSQLGVGATTISNLFYNCNTSLFGVGAYTNIFIFTGPAPIRIVAGTYLGFANNGTATLVLDTGSGRAFDYPGGSRYLTLGSNDTWIGIVQTNAGTVCIKTLGGTVLPQLTVTGGLYFPSATNAPQTQPFLAGPALLVITNGQTIDTFSNGVLVAATAFPLWQDTNIVSTTDGSGNLVLYSSLIATVKGAVITSVSGSVGDPMVWPTKIVSNSVIAHAEEFSVDVGNGGIQTFSAATFTNAVHFFR